MSATTGIAWTDATWNPWMGCLKVSPGCKACYMYRDQERYGQDPKAVRRSKTKFRDPLKWAAPRHVAIAERRIRDAEAQLPLGLSA